MHTPPEPASRAARGVDRGPEPAPAVGPESPPAVERVARRLYRHPLLDAAACRELVARWVDRTALRLGFARLQSGQLIRYPPGGYYQWHRDSATPRFRKVSALLYLSDAGSLAGAGGETLFAPRRLRKHWRPIAIAPACGTALIFDSRLYHRALPTIAGAKVVLLMMFV